MWGCGRHRPLAATNDEGVQWTIPPSPYQRCGGVGYKTAGREIHTPVSLVSCLPTIRGCGRRKRRSEIPRPLIVGRGIPTMRGCERRFTNDTGVPWPRLPTIWGRRKPGYQRCAGADPRETNDEGVRQPRLPMIEGCGRKGDQRCGGAARRDTNDMGVRREGIPTMWGCGWGGGGSEEGERIERVAKWGMAKWRRVSSGLRNGGRGRRGRGSE